MRICTRSPQKFIKKKPLESGLKMSAQDLFGTSAKNICLISAQGLLGVSTRSRSLQGTLSDACQRKSVVSKQSSRRLPTLKNLKNTVSNGSSSPLSPSFHRNFFGLTRLYPSAAKRFRTKRPPRPPAKIHDRWEHVPILVRNHQNVWWIFLIKRSPIVSICFCQ